MVRISEFEKNHPFEKRLEEATKILQKYPDRIPVIVERGSNDKNLPDIKNKKYLVPSDMIFSQLIYVIRKRIKISSEKALFVMVNDTLPPNSAILADLYDQYKSPDLFLRVFYISESTFGDFYL